MDISKEISQEVDAEIKFEDGKLVIVGKFDSKGLDIEASLKFEGEYFLDKLAKAIPGEVDDMVIAALKAAIK